jgi:hypothetical protein
LEDQTDHLLFFCHLCSPEAKTLLSRFLVALPPAPDLLPCAKHLFVAANGSSDCDVGLRTAAGSALSPAAEP